MKRVAVRVDGAGQQRLAGQALDDRGSPPAPGAGPTSAIRPSAMAIARPRSKRPSIRTRSGARRVIAARCSDRRRAGRNGSSQAHHARQIVGRSGRAVVGSVMGLGPPVCVRRDRRGVTAGRPRHLTVTSPEAQRASAPTGRRGLLRQDELAGPRDPEAIFVVSVQDDQFPQALEEVVACDGPPGWKCRSVPARCVRCGTSARGGHGALFRSRAPRLPAPRESRTTDPAIARFIGASPHE